MIDLLRQLSLTEYESKAYLALLRYGTLDGKQASKHSLVPYSAVHFVLQQLVQKNFAVIVSRKPMRFKAIKPETSLNALVKEKNAELAKLKESTLSELGKLKHLPSETEEERVDISAGKQQRFAHAVQLTSQIKKEKLIISMVDVHPLEIFKEEKALIKRGAKGKLIATIADEKNMPILQKFKNIGFKVRHYAPLYGFSLIVYDRKVSTIVVMDPKKREAVYNLKLNSKALAEAFAEYFDFVWKKAKPV